MAPTDAPRKRWRRLKWILAAGLILVLGTVSCLPWLASTPVARSMLVATANGMLAPSRVELGGVEFSWSGPQQIRGLVLRDRAGKALISAPRIRVGRSLLGLAFERPLKTTVVIEGADVSIERRPDGSIDLLDAVAPLMGGGNDARTAADKADRAETERHTEPGPDIDLKLVKGTLVVRSPELPEPVRARNFEMAVHVASAGGPTTWKIALAGPAERDDASLVLSGELPPAAEGSTATNLAATLVAIRWPWSVATQGVTARGRLDGKFATTRKAGRWSVSGDGQVLELDARGPGLQGDRLVVDRTTVALDAVMADGGWVVPRLDVACPLGSLKALGESKTGGTSALTSKIEGTIDLAALGRQLPHALRLREGLIVEKGEATIHIELAHQKPETSQVVVEGRLSDLLARDGNRAVALRNPASISARVIRKPDDLHVDRLEIKTAFLNATGSGDLDRGVTVAATIDLAGLKTQLQDFVDFQGLEIAGQGRLGADYRRGAGGKYVARFAAELKAPRLSGMTAKPIARKSLRFDAAGSGLVGDAGLPTGWSEAKLSVATDDLTASTRLSTGASAEIIGIEEMHLEIPMKTAGAPDELIRLAASGRYHPGQGVLELHPLPGNQKPEPIVLGAEGLSIQGLNRDAELHVSASVKGDLARLDRALAWWTESSPMGVAGAMTLKTGVVRKANGDVTIAKSFESPDFSMEGSPETGRRMLGPVVVAATSTRPASGDRIVFKNIAMAFRYASLHASGQVLDPTGARVAALDGTIVPNWATVDPLIAQMTEPGARVRCEFRPFHIRGPLPAGGLVSLLQGIDAELAVDRFEAVAFGVKVAPTPIVLHWRKKKGYIEPIATTVNDGPTNLRPDMLIDDTGTLLLRMTGGASIQNAEINEAVSQSLLSYVAPVLRDASRVRGKVSMNVQNAEFPIAGDENRQCKLIGRIEFNDVVFVAGKFADELLSMTGKGKQASIQLKESIDLAIADGRVTQKGLVVPLGRDTRIELEGSVGFDQRLAMRARVPVPRSVLGNRPEAADLLEALRVGVPIGGTLSRPTIDKRALRVGLGQAGRSVLERGAADLIRGLTQPRDARSKPGSPNP